MKRTTLKSFSADQTREYAAALAREILATAPPRAALVVALIGDLGAGKTEFVKGFLHACGVRVRAASPSFVIMKRYKLFKKRYRSVYHFDLYRLEKKTIRKSLASCGIDEAMKRGSLVLVEWADRAKYLTTKNSLIIKISHKKREHDRRITISWR